MILIKCVNTKLTLMFLICTCVRIYLLIQKPTSLKKEIHTKILSTFRKLPKLRPFFARLLGLMLI